MTAKRKRKISNARQSGVCFARTVVAGEDSHDRSTPSPVSRPHRPARRGRGSRHRRGSRGRHAALSEARAPPAPAGGAGAPEGAEGRQGPSRVPEDLLGEARSDAGHRGQRVRGQRPRGLEARGRRLLLRQPEGLGDRLRAGPRPARPPGGRPRQGRRSAPTGRAGHGPRGTGAPGRARPGQAVRQHGLPARGLDTRAGDLGLPRPARSPLPLHGGRAARRSSTPSAGSRRAASSPRTCIAPRPRSSRGPTWPTTAGATGTSCRSPRSGARRREPSIS